MAGDEWLISREAADGGRLGLRFVRRGDRLHQSIEWLAAADSQSTVSAGQSAGVDRSTTRFAPCLLESLEGQSGDIWPASPPMQQLLIESRAEAGHVALLVGMAGRSHWSLSVEPLADRVGFRFDAACRLSGPPEWLGHAWHPSNLLVPLAIDPPASQSLGETNRDTDSATNAGARVCEWRLTSGWSESLQSESWESQSWQTQSRQSERRQSESGKSESGQSQSGWLRIVAEGGAECQQWVGEASANSGECRIQAAGVGAVVAAGRFPATVQWRFVIEWSPERWR